MSRFTLIRRRCESSDPRYDVWDACVNLEASGEAGKRKRMRVVPGKVFRGEKIVAEDSGDGLATGIVDFKIGKRRQLPTSHRLMTVYLKENPLGGGIKFDTCEVGDAIEVKIEFIRDAAWRGWVFGKALVEKSR